MGAIAPMARGDIFQWKPGTGLGSPPAQSTDLCPDGAGVSPGPAADLSNRDLTKAYLAGFDMTGANFSNTNLATAYLDHSTLSFANLSGANLSNITAASYVIVNDANLTSVNFTGAQLYGMYFDRSDLTNANFSGAKVSGAGFNAATITGANFRDADWGYDGFRYSLALTKNWTTLHDLHGIALGTINLSGANLSSFNLAGTDFSQASITNATFTKANIAGADFSGTSLGTAQLYSTASYVAKNLGAINLSKKTLDYSWDFGTQSMAGASLRSSQINGVDFWYADLQGADFGSARIVSSSFTSANIAGSNFENATVSGANFGNSNLTGANFRYATLTGLDFVDAASHKPQANLTGADFTGATIANVTFGSSLSSSQLRSTASYQQKQFVSLRISSMDLSGSDLSDFNLNGSVLEYIAMPGGNFGRADLGNGYCGSCNFVGANFSDANLGSTWFSACALSGSNFSRANLASAVFDNGSLDGADFTGATLRGAHLNSSMVNVDLRGHDLTSTSLSGTFTGVDFTDTIITSGVITGGTAGGKGLSRAQFESTASFKNHNLKGVRFYGDISGWDLSDQDLEGGALGKTSGDGAPGAYAQIEGTDFTNSNIAGCGFLGLTSKGFTPAQLYSTASYKRHDLHGIDFGGHFALAPSNLTGWNFDEQNLVLASFEGADLTNASFRGAFLAGVSLGANLSGTDFRLADLRNTYDHFASGVAIKTNSILKDGKILGLHLMNSDTLVVRDLDPLTIYGSVYPPLPVRVMSNMQLESGSELKLELHDGNWASTIRVDAAIPVQLGGTLGLGVSPSAIISELIGSPIQAFVWTDPLAAGTEFDQILTDDRFVWDLSNLYSTGTIKIVHLKGDANDDGQVDIHDLYTLAINWKKTADAWDDADFNLDGVVNAKDLGILAINWQVGVENPSSSSLSVLATSLGLPASAVPEPVGSMILILGALLSRRRRAARAHPLH